MATRRFVLIALLTASACDKAPPTAPQRTVAAATAAKDNRVLCALRGAAEFSPGCVLDEKGSLLTIQAPDGSFRRLRVTHDGRGVITADGAEPALVTIVGNKQIEVAVGNDRYRLPATVK